MKKALLILHQKRSRSADIGNKLLARGFKLDIRKPALGDKLPSSMNNHDLAIIFGGPISINDNSLDFIKYEIDWIGNALSSQKPFLGICLGAQMLAKYLGGKVNYYSDKSSEIGFFDIFPINEGKDIFKDQTIFFQWHNECFTLPKSCKILAQGHKFENQAFKYNNAYGFQFHPEVNFYLHLRWLFYVCLYTPHKLQVKGAQSIYKQILLRIQYNKDLSNWLEYFLDNYLLKS